jgi:CHAT domain-containing protein
VSLALRDTPNVLHIAAHAVMNPWRPRHSALLLAPSADGNPWWEAAAIARTPMDVELVVLSACRSARRGAPWRGGFGGLADAFLRAGAKAVVGSLWSVEDAEARRVMREFYRRLPAEPIAAALRHTQLALISDGRQPATWAAWVLRD